MIRFTYICLILLLLSCSIAFGNQSDKGDGEALAQKGILDLRKWDFSKQQTVNLYGEWRFFWRSYITPGVYAEPELDYKENYISLPRYWNGIVSDKETIDGIGYATFWLTVLLPTNAKKMSLKINDIQTSYRAFVNGVEVAANGNPGTSQETTIPAYIPTVAAVETVDSKLEIIFHVANFHHKKGGIWESVILGSSDEIRQKRENRLTIEIFLIGAILIMGIYHIGLFFHRRSDRSALHFGIFCLIIVIRSLTTGERYITQILSGADWEALHKMEYISFYIALPVFAMFIHSLFPKEFSLKALRISQATGISFCLVVLFTPSIIYTHTTQAYQLVTVFTGIYFLLILILAIKRKREGALILLCGFALLFITVLNDILHVNQVVHTGFYLSFGLFVFIFSQAFLIALRFSKAFHTVENQTWELIKTNDAFSLEIKERKKLEKNLLESHEKFEKSRVGIILGLAKLAEYRDEDTGDHLERMREYCRILATELSQIDEYRGYITEAYINDLYQSSILHDIGKVGIPDSILLKPGKLTEEEFDTMQQHSKIGGDAILNVEARIDMRSFLTLGREIAYGHHEKWDGSGYPKGLKGKEIPLSARIVALADVYDALTSERPYKKPFSHEKSRSIILKSNGSHFDPVIVKAFLTRESEFEEVRKRFQND